MTRPTKAPVVQRRAAPGTPVLEPNEARAGITRQNVRVVLAISLAGAVIVLAIVWFVFFGGSSPR